jgi:hypothetical protein
MMITDINSEDRLGQKTFAEHFEKVLEWEGVYTYDTGTFRRNETLGYLNCLLILRPLGGQIGTEEKMYCIFPRWLDRPSRRNTVYPLHSRPQPMQRPWCIIEL